MHPRSFVSKNKECVRERDREIEREKEIEKEIEKEWEIYEEKCDRVVSYAFTKLKCNLNLFVMLNASF